MSLEEHVQVPFQDLYADVFRNHVSLLFEQVDAGLYSLKRYGYYLQKMCSHRKPALLDLLKDTEHESSKKDRAEMDRAGNHVRAYRHMQDIQFQLLHDELRFVISVSETVAEPLLAWHKNAEKRKEALIKREEKMSKELKDVQAKVASARKDCHKQWSVAQGIYKDYAKVEAYLKENPNATKGKYTVKDLANIEKKIEKERAKAISLFAALESCIAAANRTQDAYWNTELPALLQDLEHLEAERLSMLGSHMLLYSHLQQGQVQPLANAAAMLADDVRALNGAEEMREIATSLTRQHGPAQGPPVLQPQLPCSSSDLGSMPLGSLYSLLAQDINVAIEQSKEKEALVPTVFVNKGHPVLESSGAVGPITLSPPSSTPFAGLAIATPTDTAACAQPGSPTAMFATSIAPPSAPPAAVPAAPAAASPDFGLDTKDTGSAAGAVPEVSSPASPPPAFTPGHGAAPPLPASHLPTPATRSSLGLFPINAPRGTLCMCVGLFDFDGTDEEDLVFSEGDLIAVFSQPEGSEWWVGVKFDGSTGEIIARGAFPANYVELVASEDEYTCV